MAYSAGTGFVQVAPSLRGFHQQIRTELAAIKETVTVKVTPVIDRSGFNSVPRVPDQTVKVTAKVDQKSFVDASNAASLFLRNLATPATFVAAAAAIPTLLDFTAAAGTASQALLLLPAAGVSAAIVMGTVKTATSGMGDAFKQIFAADQNPAKLAEALGQLSPNARAFAVEVQSLRPQLTGLRQDVQDVAFRNMAAEVNQLSGSYLPLLRTQMTGVAAELNTGALGIAQFVGQAATVRDVNTIFDNTRLSVANVVPAGVQVVAIFRDIATVGSGFLPQIATGFTNITIRAREFVAAARESGQLAAWMQQGVTAVSLLGQTFVNVGGIIVGVIRGANTDSLGFLRTIVDLTARVREFVNSAQGQTALTEFFTNLRAVASALVPLLVLVASTAVGMVNTLGPILPAVVTALTDVLLAAQPLTSTFSELALVVIPPLAGAISFLAPVLGPLVALMVGARIATAAWTAATTIATAAQVAYRVGMGLAAAVQLAYTLATNSGALALTVWAAKQWLVNAALAANPIGIVVVALGLLVAGLVLAWNHSETFRAVVTGAWEGVKAAFSTAWAVIQSVFAGIVQAGRDAWTWLQGIFTSIGQGASALGGWFTGLWHDYVEPAWRGIVTVAQWALAILLTIVFAPIQIAINVLGAVWQELQVIVSNVWTTIQEEAQIWWDFLRGIFTAVYDYVSGVFSRVFQEWQLLVTTVFNAVWEEINRWWNTYVAPILQIVIDFLLGPLTTGFTMWRDLTIAVFNAVWAMVQQWWNTWVLPLMNIVITFFTVTVPAAFEQFRALVSEKWNALWLYIQNWWNAWVQPLINIVMTFFTVTVVNAYEQFRAGVQSKWDALWTYLQGWWNTWVQPLLNTVINFITVTLPNGFQSGVDKIRAVWETIKAALRTPLQAAIDIVWNNGIAKVWENVRAIIPGLPGIPGVPFILPFAAGGPVERPTLGLIGEAGPEYVLSAPAVRNLGGMGAVDALHNTALSPRRTLRQMNAGQFVEGADHDGPGISAAGFGGVRPHVARAGHYLGPKFGITTIGGVGARANASDHPGGLALDFMTSTDRGTQLADFLSSNANWNHFSVKYIIWRQRIRNGPGAGWSAMADRGSPTANHMDHVHVSFTGTPGVGAMDGGGGGPSILDLLTGAWQTVRDAVGKLGGIAGAGSLWGQAVTGFGRKIVDSAWGYLAGRASEMMAVASANLAANGVAVVGPNGEVIGTVGGAGSPQAQVNAVAARYGWGGGAQWSALVQIIQKESSWNPNAANPTSSARGLFQQMTSIYGPVAPTAGGQAEWGLNYIRSRYGTPTAALAFHNANGWYDAGGLASGAGFLAKATIAPERVLSARQTDAFEQLVATISRGRGTVSTDRFGRGHRDGIGGASGGEGGALIGSLTVPVPEGAGIQETLDSVFTRARHEQRRGRYSHR